MTLVGATPTDVDIAEFLRSEGFGGTAEAIARHVLEAAGLTRAGKQRMAAEKVDRARGVLRGHLIRLCHRAQCRHSGDARQVVFVTPPHCEHCRGSAQRRAAQLASEAMRAAGYSHVLVVGGAKATHAALTEALGGGGVAVRCVDGKQGTRSVATVEADLAWADLMVVWATTPLPHKVSQPYTSRARGLLPCITVPRRGVEAVCDELLRFCNGGRMRTTT